MRVIYEFGQDILSKCLQCTASFIEHNKWIELDQYDLFVTIIKGPNNIANHAIGIYNNQIFDSNESFVIPLCQEGFNYCVSTTGVGNQFVSFTGGFFVQENSKKGRLKRRPVNNASFDSSVNRNMGKKNA